MFKWLSRTPIETRCVSPGDIFRVFRHGEFIGETLITQPMQINQLSFFEFEREYGLSKGIGVILGEREVDNDYR